MRLRLGLATSTGCLEIDDDPVHAYLRARDCVVEQPIWDDPAVDWASYDAVVPRTTWDYHDEREAFLEWIRRVDAVSRLLNPAPVLAWNTHKSYLRELAEHGVPLAPSEWFVGGQRVDLAGVVRRRGWERGFLKPLVGATARETLRFRCDAPESLAAAQAHLDRMVLEQGEDMLLQPYLESVEHVGEVSAIYFEGALSHAVRKVPTPGDYRVQDDFDAYDEPFALDGEAQGLIDATLAALGVCAARLEPAPTLPLLYARVDMLRDADGRWVLNELELVEPSLFFRHAPSASVATFAEGLLRRVRPG